MGDNTLNLEKVVVSLVAILVGVVVVRVLIAKLIAIAIVVFVVSGLIWCVTGNLVSYLGTASLRQL